MYVRIKPQTKDLEDASDFEHGRGGEGTERKRDTNKSRRVVQKARARVSGLGESED